MAISKGSSITEKLIPIGLILVVGLAFMVGVLWEKVTALEKNKTAGTTNTTTTAGNPAPTVSLDTIKSLYGMNLIKFGDDSKKVLFVEVGDPSCPFCHVSSGADPETAKSVGTQFQYVSDGGSYVPPVTEMKKLVESGEASYAFVYFPGHGNGEMATKALYCAFDQGKFWEAHPVVYSAKGYSFWNDTIKNDKTKSQEVASFLAGVTNSATLKECLDSGKYDQRLSDEQNLASGTLGVTGTPGFFVNSTNFAGAYSWADMKSAVDEAL